uniref:Predicted protein n=1 Tax=Hordeum vulgare subsp. vulgare TaxID=112509 RepID=F2EBU2_HORVV|nr:predicted protein [Hordeum vulgare subsp. vulgare]
MEHRAGTTAAGTDVVGSGQGAFQSPPAGSFEVESVGEHDRRGRDDGDRRKDVADEQVPHARHKGVHTLSDMPIRTYHLKGGYCCLHTLRDGCCWHSRAAVRRG